MKETKIAKENVEEVYNIVAPTVKGMEREKVRIHKATCQRWLEFLDLFIACESCCPDTFKSKIKPKITDLKQTIKIYEDNGI